MATINNFNNKMIQMSPNIVIALDDNNIGEMYVFDDKYRYILNGLTASDLVYHFADDDNNLHISEEIQDTMMEIIVNQGTH